MAATAARDVSVGVAEDFGWALGTLLRAYLRELRRVVADLPGGPRAYQVMMMAASATVENQASIAQRLGLDRTVMTYLIDGLEVDGLVRRTPDPDDRRARRVTLTTKGVRVHAALTDQVTQIEQRLLSGLADGESELLRGALIRTAHLLDDGRDGCGGDEVDPCEIDPTQRSPAHG